MYRKLKRLLAITLVALTVMTACMPAFAAGLRPPSASGTSSGGTSVGSGSVENCAASKLQLNVRTGPGTSYKKIGYLKTGTIVKCIGTSGKWTKIDLGNNGIGYVFTSHLRNVGSASASQVNNGLVLTGEPVQNTTSAADGSTAAATLQLNVRTGPGTSYKQLGYLETGTVVKCVGTSGKWTKIDLGNNSIGYVFTSYLRSVGSASASQINKGLVLYGSSGTATGSTSTGSANRSLKELINTTPLSPVRTNDSGLDRRIEQIFADITTSSMTTYDKLRAFYRWLVRNTKEMGTGYGTFYLKGTYNSYTDEFVVVLAEDQLTTMAGGRGTCDAYAASLVVAARYLGLPAYKVGGKYVNSEGKQSAHSWMILMLDGTPYIFDAQLEFLNTGGSPDFSRFGVTGGKWDSRYVYTKSLQSQMQEYGGFRR